MYVYVCLLLEKSSIQEYGKKKGELLVVPTATFLPTKLP